MINKAIAVHDIRSALTESYQGKSGRNVYARSYPGEWIRINAIETRKGTLYARALNSGKWFPVHAWEER